MKFAHIFIHPFIFHNMRVYKNFQNLSYNKIQVQKYTYAKVRKNKNKNTRD